MEHINLICNALNAQINANYVIQLVLLHKYIAESVHNQISWLLIILVDAYLTV